MNKKDLQLFLSQDSKDVINFIFKSYDIILDKYGYDVEDWYLSKTKSVHNLKKKTLTKVLYFYHVKDSGLEIVKITCEQDKIDNMKTITHFKSFISFNNIQKISFYSEDKNEILIESSVVVSRLSYIDHAFGKITDQELANFFNLNIPIEPFHRLLVRKFDEFCEHEYNKNQFSKADEIKKFKELLDEGTITQDEFELFKKDLLK